jgi:hypothetical protein
MACVGLRHDLPTAKKLQKPQCLQPLCKAKSLCATDGRPKDSCTLSSCIWFASGQVFDAKSWEALLMRSILPKLAAGLAGLIIDPSNQPPHSLSPWHDAMAWQPYLAPGQVPPPLSLSLSSLFSETRLVLELILEVTTLQPRGLRRCSVLLTMQTYIVV